MDTERGLQHIPGGPLLPTQLQTTYKTVNRKGICPLCADGTLSDDTGYLSQSANHGMAQMGLQLREEPEKKGLGGNTPNFQ